MSVSELSLERNTKLKRSLENSFQSIGAILMLIEYYDSFYRNQI